MLDSYIYREINGFKKYFKQGDEVIFNGKPCYVEGVYETFLELNGFNGESYCLDIHKLNYNNLSKGGIEYMNPKGRK